METLKKIYSKNKSDGRILKTSKQMTEKIKTEKEKKLEKYLEQSVKNNAPLQYQQIHEAKELPGVMILLESTDMKISANYEQSFAIIGMVVKYAAINGVEIRVVPDGTANLEEISEKIKEKKQLV